MNKTKKPRKRILYIADSTSVHTQRWLKYFADCGHEIYIITIGKKRQTLPYAHHVFNFDRFYYNSPIFLKYLFKTKRLIQAIKPDILHAHFVHQYGWLAALSGFHPFILTAWGTDVLKLPYASRGKLGKWLTQYALKKADIITATSSAARNEVIALGADRKKTQVIFWGVDTQIFHPDIDVEDFRKSLSIPEKAQIVLSNRNCAPLYNIDIIIKAMVNVLKQYPETILILQNAAEKNSYVSELKRLVSVNGIEGAVRFLPSYPHEKLPPLYALADIYVSVPTWDAGPVSLKEAMASHCAPIVSLVAGPLEWIVNGENGIVVPIRHVERLAEAVIDLINDNEKRYIYQRINRQLIEKRATHLNQMKKAEAIYQRMTTHQMKRRGHDHAVAKGKKGSSRQLT
jgi:L-malate glycosyltransferase